MVLIILLCLASVTLLGWVVGAVLDNVVAGVIAAAVAFTSLFVMAWKYAGRKQRELERGRPYRHGTDENDSR